MPKTATERPRLSLKGHRLIALALAISMLWSGYLLKYGLCEPQSKFCVVGIAFTRTDVGFEWDSWSFYITTEPLDG